MELPAARDNPGANKGRSTAKRAAPARRRVMVPSEFLGSNQDGLNGLKGNGRTAQTGADSNNREMELKGLDTDGFKGLRHRRRRHRRDFNGRLPGPLHANGAGFRALLRPTVKKLVQEKNCENQQKQADNRTM
jgi:hypothetical protein